MFSALLKVNINNFAITNLHESKLSLQTREKITNDLMKRCDFRVGQVERVDPLMGDIDDSVAFSNPKQHALGT